MKISHELPLSLMHNAYKWNDYDYCLPHLIDQYDQYKIFFQKSIEAIFTSSTTICNSIEYLHITIKCRKRLGFNLDYIRNLKHLKGLFKTDKFNKDLEKDELNKKLVSFEYIPEDLVTEFMSTIKK
jgi:hypothetical protein